MLSWYCIQLWVEGPWYDNIGAFFLKWFFSCQPVFFKFDICWLHRFPGMRSWMRGQTALCIMKVNCSLSNISLRWAITPATLERLLCASCKLSKSFTTAFCPLSSIALCSFWCTISVSTSCPCGMLSVDFLTSMASGASSLGQAVKALHILLSTKSSTSFGLAFWK